MSEHGVTHNGLPIPMRSVWELAKAGKGQVEIVFTGALGQLLTNAFDARTDHGVPVYYDGVLPRLAGQRRKR